MLRRFFYISIPALAILVGLYPLIYFIVDGKFGFMFSKSDALLASMPWKVAFKTHIGMGGIALLTGWTQFVNKWRVRYLSLHRRIGKVYVISVLLSSLAGIYIGINATGGIISSTGFISLGIFWFTTTLLAWLQIRNRRVVAHTQMMIYSYAACLAAVTLRIYLPILTAILNDFETAYTIVAWLCWVPNVIIACFIVERKYYVKLFQ